jgi:tetratricopeptide (TPR) repeat protein
MNGLLTLGIRGCLLVLLGLASVGCQNPESLMQRGNMAYRSGDKTAAAGYYQQALAFEKTRAAASFNLGRVALEQGQSQQAKEYFDKALELELEYPLVRVYRARASLALGETESATQDLERVTTTHPDLVDGFLELAKLRAAAGDLEAAIQTVQPARASRTLNEEATLLSAEWRHKTGDLAQAIADLEGLVSTHSYRIPTHFTLAGYLLEAGDFREAERRYRRGLEMEPTNVEALLGLAQALAGQGKKEEATRFFGVVMKSGPEDHPLVIRARQGLEQLGPRN